MQVKSDRIPDSFKDLLERPVFVTLVTVMPNGQPQATPVWVDYDGEFVRVNSARGRQKDRNMERNPHVTVLAIDPDNPYRWMEIRGIVEHISEEGGLDHINKLSKKYRGQRGLLCPIPAAPGQRDARDLQNPPHEG